MLPPYSTENFLWEKNFGYKKTYLLLALKKKLFILHCDKSFQYRWVTFWEMIRSAGYSPIQRSCSIFLHQNEFIFSFFSLLFGGKCFLALLFDLFMSIFWRPDLSLTRRFVADTVKRCTTLTPKKNILSDLNKTRVFFLTFLQKVILPETDLYIPCNWNFKFS